MLKNVRPAVIAAATVAAVALAGSAQAEDGVKVGTLTCNVASGWGFILGSSKDLRCSFNPSGHGTEHYVGSVSKFGVDIGYTQGGVIIWEVLAPTSDLAPGALAGGYGGATASAAVGVGAGANVLIGGSTKSIELQPLSVEVYKGLNVAAGIGEITLRAAPK